MTRRLPLRPSLLLALALAAVGVAACSSDPEPFAGYTRTPTPNVAEVSLPAVDDDHSGDYDFAAASDHLLLVYFGYTSCPDVCPTTLADVSAALGRLDEAEAERVDLAMITIDPEVDTDEVVAGYVRSFVADAAAVRTVEDADLRAAADAFGADYGKLENDEGELEVYHTGSLYGVDDAGDLVIVWPFGTSASDLASDMARILDGETVA